MRAASSLLFLALLLSSCRKATPEAAGTGSLRVSVGIPPLRSVVTAIGGDAVEVASLMSDMDDPHTFSPTPQAVATLRDARIFFTLGLDYEKALAGKLEQKFPELVLSDASRAVPRLGGHHHHHEGEDHDHDACLQGADPHVWLSLANLALIADTVREDLARLAPEHAEEFGRRCAQYKEALAARHAEFVERLKPLEPRAFCVYHPVFGYFARDYDLHQATVEIDGKAPTPRQLRELYDEAAEEGFRVVFVQPQFNPGPAKAIADKIGGRVVRINPLSEDPVGVLAAGVEALAGEL